jgi:hypothetical protein
LQRPSQDAARSSRTTSGWSDIQAPHEPVRIAPLRLALHEERFAADRELVARARVCNLACAQLEGRGLGVDAGLAEADDRVGPPGNRPLKFRRGDLRPGQKVEGRRTMTVYTPPLEDMRFVLRHLVDLEAIARLPGYEATSPDLVDQILEEAGRFAANELAPLNASGDRD